VTEPTFTLTCTEAQARVLEQACDLMTRLGLGQVREVLDYIPTKGYVPHRVPAKILPSPPVDSDKVLEHLLGVVHALGFHDFGHSYGVGHDNCPPNSMVAYDLGAVLRNAIHSLRTDADKHFSVWGNSPLHYGKEPLAVVVVTTATKPRRRPHDP